MQQQHLTYTVTPDDHDDNSGTEAQPFATLERARDAIRHMNQTAAFPAGGIMVELHQGV